MTWNRYPLANENLTLKRNQYNCQYNRIQYMGIISDENPVLISIQPGGHGSKYIIAQVPRVS